MSYRIAQVRFRGNEQTYPVNCYRADIEAGDVVIVEMPDQNALKTAFVTNIEFKNWNCRNSILCLSSEITFYPSGDYKVETDYRSNGMIHTLDDLWARLRRSGWVPHRPAQKSFKVVYSLVRGQKTASMWFRRNGIDFRLSNFDSGGPATEGGADAPLQARAVAHWYHNSEVDLYQLCIAFADTFSAGRSDWDEFFVPRGKKFAKPSTPGFGHELRDIYDAISSGGGGPAYLNDGVWLGPSGKLWND